MRALALGADYLVIHPGSALGASVESSIAAVVYGIKQASRGLKFGDLRILLENTAGQGSSLGSRFEELKAILDACPDLPLGVCIDTAHTFAAGWSIHTEEGLQVTLREIDRTVGLHRVFVLHVNDSKTHTGFARGPSPEHWQRPNRLESLRQNPESPAACEVRIYSRNAY